MTKEYNEKEFLLPDSIDSCSIYHARVYEDGRYMFKMHDCHNGIRLVGELNTPQGRADAVAKTQRLIDGLTAFQKHIDGLDKTYNPLM